MMVSSLSTNLASAKHVHRHNKVIAFKHNCKPLKFNQLIKVMNKDYKLYIHTTLRNNNKNRERLSNKYYRIIMYTLWVNLSHYNKTQLKKICDNPDASVTCYAKKQDINHIRSISNYSISEYINSKNLVKTNEVPKLAKQDTPFDTQIRKYLIKDINKTRAKYKKKPLIVDNIMQKVANYRAPKVLYAYEHSNDCLKYEHITPSQLAAQGGSTDKWIHGIDTNTSGCDYLNAHKYASSELSSNAGGINYDQSFSYDNVPYKYPSNSPKNIAYNMNDDYINNDDFYPARNGHRRAELDPHAKYLGVGVAYDPKTQLFVNDEQFYE